MTARTITLALALALCACAPRVEPPRPPLPDASYDASTDVRLIIIDAGPRPDVPRDAPRPDAPEPDAPPDAPDARPTDAGSATTTIDGRLVEAVWADALTTTTAVVAGPPFTGCALGELLVASSSTSLLLGVRGTLDAACAGAAFVVYVDLDVADGAGLVLDGTGGADISGNLDGVISGPLNGLGSGLFPDVAWGTLMMSVGRSTGTNDFGWRRVAVAPFQAAVGQVSACTATECESSITFAALALGSGPHTLEIFARLGDGLEWAAPTLPEEFPPEVVATSLSVDVVVP